MELDGFPVCRDAFPRTVRLVTTARLRESVLKKLVGDEDLQALAEIEGATSARLIAQSRGRAAIKPTDFVYDVPHASLINASFAYAKPREPNRFNGPGRGAWYAALDVATCLAEVAFHMRRVLAQAGDFHAVVDYAEMHASLAGEFLDLRQSEGRHAALDPDPRIGYPAGNALADTARAAGLNGIVYPSVRHAGGTCFAVLRAPAVQSVAQGSVHRLIWNGRPEPTVTQIA